MPTYLCTTPAGSLTKAQKAAVAKAITRVHNHVTGAPGFFAEVIFKEIAAGDWFIGGEPLANEQIFVLGNVRGGRPAGMRNLLLTQLAIAVAEAASLPSHAVWIYLSELPPSAMMEYGHVLPEPGAEAAWIAALPEQDRKRMESSGGGV